MAIDQRDVSSTLRFMDDRALQQYAAMHKNDPYIFPLAFQESQNRQRLRMSQQTAQGMQPQPKVADQALAQMAPQPLPEEQGIGALPAGNMQQMADGGIAGYDDDANFAARSEPVVMMAGGGVPRYAGEDESLVEDTSSTLGNFFGDIRDYFARQSDQSQETQRRIRAANEAKRQIYETQPGLLEQLTPTQRKEREKQVNALKQPQEYVRQQDKLMKGYVPRRAGDEFEAEEKMASDRAANPPVVAPAAAPARKDAPAAKRGSAGSTAAGSAPAGSAPRDQFDVESMMNTALAKAEAKPDPYEARLKEINTAKETQAKENVSGLEAIQKQFADIYKGRKDRLDTREGEIGKMKDQSLGLALLNAGAAMMGTRGSIGEALGAGIATGSKQYAAGLDKINSAKEKLSEARDRMEEIEAQRGEMSARELHKARNEVKSITTAGMEDLVKAAMAERKLNRTEAIAFVNAQLQANLKLKEISSRSADTQALIAARGDTAGNKQAKLQLDTLKAQAAAISKELTDPASMMSLPRNAALKQAKQAELARINAQMNQIAGLSTMAPASPVGTSSGVQFLGYE